jgi:hypothetical protein
VKTAKFVIGGICVVLASGARAQEPSADDVLTPPADRWTIRFEPSAWYAAPGGEARLPGSSAKVQFIDLNLDQPRLAPYGELHFRNGDFRVSLSGFSVSLDDVATVVSAPMQIGSVAVGAGDLVVSSVSITSGELVGAMQIGSPRGLDGKVNGDFALSFELLGGVRMYHVDLSFAAPAGRIEADEFFLTPVVGVKSTINVHERFDIDLQVMGGALPVGGGRAAFCMEILNGYVYRPVPNVGVQIGYRLSYCSLEDGEGISAFEYSGAVAGVFAGVVVRF